MSPLHNLLHEPLDLGYDAKQGPDQPAQQALRRGRGEVAQIVPPGYRVRVSGAAQNLPFIPWCAVLDRDVTETAQEGLYVVYLFTQDLRHVYLSMNQGVTAHRENFRKSRVRDAAGAALRELARESEIIRPALPEALIADLLSEIELGGTRFLPRAYEAGNIVALKYDVTDLPAEDLLLEDLDRFLSIYQECVLVRNEILIAEPGRLQTRTKRSASDESMSRPPVFRPKDASDYIAHVAEQVQRRGRKHES